MNCLECVARAREQKDAPRETKNKMPMKVATFSSFFCSSRSREGRVTPAISEFASWNSSARSNSSFIRLSRSEPAEYLDRYRRDCKSRITAGRRDSNRHRAAPVYGTFSAPLGFQARCVRLERRRKRRRIKRGRSYRLRHTYVQKRLGITSLEIYPR